MPAKNIFYDQLLYECILGRPDFLARTPVTFFGILGVCMKWPEKDLAQGGRLLM